MFIQVSKLESILFSKAFESSFYTNFRSEFNIEKILDMTITHGGISLSQNAFVLSTVILFTYGQFMYIQGARATENKYEKIPKYQQFQYKFKLLMSLLLIIFVKDVQNAI